MTVTEAVELSLSGPAQGPQEPLDLERCTIERWGDRLGDADPDWSAEEARQAGLYPTQVSCAFCRHVQPAPSREQPNCTRCGTWLLENRKL